MRYRVDALAARSGVSVDTVRFYQAKGLLEAPEREGRVAYYSDRHVEALERIRDLKAKGFTLATIRRMLAGELDAADQALVAALAEPPIDEAPERLTLDQLAERTGVSPALLVAVEREGLLAAQVRDEVATYSAADLAAIRAGMELLEAGLPLTDLLELARAHDRAVRPIAEQAVEMFDRHVRRPLRDSGPPGEDDGRRLVDAFNTTFAATTTLVAHRFGRLLLAIAQQRIDDSDEPSEERPETRTARA